MSERYYVNDFHFIDYAGEQDIEEHDDITELTRIDGRIYDFGSLILFRDPFLTYSNTGACLIHGGRRMFRRFTARAIRTFAYDDAQFEHLVYWDVEDGRRFDDPDSHRQYDECCLYGDHFYVIFADVGDMYAVRDDGVEMRVDIEPHGDLDASIAFLEAELIARNSLGYFGYYSEDYPAVIEMNIDRMERGDTADHSHTDACALMDAFGYSNSGGAYDYGRYRPSSIEDIKHGTGTEGNYGDLHILSMEEITSDLRSGSVAEILSEETSVLDGGRSMHIMSFGDRRGKKKK